MSTTAKKAIIRALLDGVLTDLWPQTSGEQVMLDDTTTLSAKLAEFIVALNDKATTAALNEGLAGKANTGHGHEQGDISGLSAALAAKASTADLSAAIAALRTEVMGEGVPEAYDTFKELADYIEAHQEVSDALNAAIGAKADKTAVEALQAVVDALGDLASKNQVSEADLDAALLAKITAATTGSHTHSNKSVLDGITADKVNAWDAKSRVHVGTTQPSDLAAGDLWFQIVE